MNTSRARFCVAALPILILAVPLTGASNKKATSNQDEGAPVRQIIVPGEKRFTPFAITVRVGQVVEWVNNDSDDHAIVSNDAFNTAGHRGLNVVVPAGGRFRLRFHHPGVFPFYCSFHAMLDADNQPKAPGPEGGIQDSNGNFGTPMNGVVTVLGLGEEGD